MNIKWFAFLAFLILLKSSQTNSQDVRVKLCGREFIRMVVTSCGSPRLKRQASDSYHPFANLQWSLKNWLYRDLFAYQKGTLAGEDKQWREHDSPESVTEQPASHHHMSPPAELLEHSTTVQDLSMSSRTRRDVGPAGVCCTSGCTMSELIQYC
ncbi:insulin-like 3 [Xyrauchen texanus]|uniref:insulin-like 3 n=1 Tax=Xyrauchen texanus TaxID=154827 RepID=UPI002242915E|nr:insulin-like 3 [Xyrauchen texanus]